MYPCPKPKNLNCVQPKKITCKPEGSEKCITSLFLGQIECDEALPAAGLAGSASATALRARGASSVRKRTECGAGASPLIFVCGFSLARFVLLNFPFANVPMPWHGCIYMVLYDACASGRWEFSVPKVPKVPKVQCGSPNGNPGPAVPVRTLQGERLRVHAIFWAQCNPT